jgi:hypothetical protein
MSAVRLSKQQCSIVATYATANAGESLTRRVVTRTPAKTVCVTKLDQWRILERRTERRLICVCSIPWFRVSYTEIPLEDDVSGTTFECSSAITEEERQTACLVLS